MKRMLEALLFARSNGIIEEELLEKLKINKEELERLVASLNSEYLDRNSGMVIKKFNEVWKMCVCDDLLALVREEIPADLNKALLKTLAVIAHKSPVEQSKVIHWRGTGAYAHIKELREMEYVERSIKGNTFVLRVTPKFYQYFDVRKKETKEEFKMALKEVEEEEKRKDEGLANNK